jgi:hypothetical protein
MGHEEVPKGGISKTNEKVQGLPFVKEEAKVEGMSKAKRKRTHPIDHSGIFDSIWHITSTTNILFLFCQFA